jgi:hypothetical protein
MLLACREAGCLREALAVASTRLLPADPAVQQLRQQYAASLTPTTAAVGDASAQPSAAAAATATGGKGAKSHPEAAAANLLLLDQPVAAATALASRTGGSNAAAMLAAAHVAALAAAHEVMLLLNPWASEILASEWREAGPLLLLLGFELCVSLCCHLSTLSLLVFLLLLFPLLYCAYAGQQ